MQELVNKQTGEITDYKPQEAVHRIAASDHGHDLAKKARDYEAMVKAIESKYKEQRKFLGWWDSEERRGGDGSNQHSSKGGIKTTIADYGFNKDQLKHWRKRDDDKALAKAYDKARIWCEGRQPQEHIITEPSPVPEGKYRTIVIDPPWDIKKIPRDVRPNQHGFDYPTISLSELAEFEPMQEAPFEECHLYCWTTQKYLPATFQLLRDWGFKYVFTMTWHKPGGFQPVGLPQYNSEFVVFGRRGGLAFDDTRAFNTCFTAMRREHSRKPDEFYDLVKRVSPEPRIDIFSREKRDGFDQYGNQEDKFSEL